MKKLIYILLLIIVILTITSCTTREEAEARNTPKPFILIIYEEDGFNYPIHKVLYNTETNLYYDYTYFYSYDGTYRNLSYMEYKVYDQNGIIVSSEVQK